MNTKDTTHRTILATLLITLTGGADMFDIPVGPFSFYPLRIAIVLASLFYGFLLLKKPKTRRLEKSDWVVLLPVSMILYGTAFSIHAENKTEAIKELGNLIFIRTGLKAHKPTRPFFKKFHLLAPWIYADTRLF
jgi:hypothetical protein